MLVFEKKSVIPDLKSSPVMLFTFFFFIEHFLHTKEKMLLVSRDH